MQNQLFLFLYRLRNGLPGEMLWLSRLSCMFSADRLGLQAYWGVALGQARGVIKKGPISLTNISLYSLDTPFLTRPRDIFCS